MKKIILHNFGLKLGALLGAFIFWQLVIGLADPVVSETFRDIPVTMLNEEIITDKGRVYQVVDGNKTVSIVVKGKTSVIREISKEDIIATANFEEIELASLVPVKVTVSNLGKETVEATATPKNIKVNIEDSASKKFPITAVSTGAVKDGHVLSGLSTQIETINVSGPESLIDEIARVEVQVNVSDIENDSELTGSLLYYDINNLTIDQTQLSNELTEAIIVTAKVLDTKEVAIEFVTTGNPTAGYEVVDITSEPSVVRIYGEDEILKNIESLSIKSASLDVTGLDGKIEIVVDITENMPEGIYLYDENAASVAVTIQIDEYGTKSIEIPVQSISVHNNPSELSLEYNGVTDVMLSFTGKDDVLEVLTINEIRLSIDLATYTKAGEYFVPVTVVTIDGCELMQEVEVPIKLVKIED